MDGDAQREPIVEFDQDIYCPACAYNLYKAPGEKCPECGYSLEGMRAAESRIPWVHRRRVGRFRSFWQTVWMVTFRNRRFCEEYARDVSYRDARLFQWVCVAHVWLTLIIATALVYVSVPAPPEPMTFLQQMLAPAGGPQTPTFLDRAFREVWPVAVELLFALLFLAAATGLPSYFFHPRAISVQRQNSAVALSYYTCGPIAATALIAICALLAYFGARLMLQPYPDPELLLPFAIAAGILAGLSVLLYWLNLVRLRRRTTPQLIGRGWAVAVGVPVMWIASAGLCLFLLPAGVFAVLVVVDSLGR